MSLVELGNYYNTLEKKYYFSRGLLVEGILTFSKTKK